MSERLERVPRAEWKSGEIETRDAETVSPRQVDAATRLKAVPRYDRDKLATKFANYIEHISRWTNLIQFH